MDKLGLVDNTCKVSLLRTVYNKISIDVSAHQILHEWLGPQNDFQYDIKDISLLDWRTVSLRYHHFAIHVCTLNKRHKHNDSSSHIIDHTLVKQRRKDK